MLQINVCYRLMYVEKFLPHLWHLTEERTPHYLANYSGALETLWLSGEIDVERPRTQSPYL